MAEPHLLILGGTGEARQLAWRLAPASGWRVTTSLAGVTAVPPGHYPGGARTGGFGGADGLAGWLARERVAALVDATHPFAVRMTGQAVRAAIIADVPLLRLERPPWIATAGDRWSEADGMADGAAACARLGRRALAAVGSKGASLLPEIAGFAWIVRGLARPDRLPAGALWIEGAPSPDPDHERALLERHAVEVVLARASGGAGAMAKLTAARELGLPVVLLRRPPPPAGVAIADGVDAALAWLEARVPR